MKNIMQRFLENLLVIGVLVGAIVSYIYLFCTMNTTWWVALLIIGLALFATIAEEWSRHNNMKRVLEGSEPTDAQKLTMKL